MKASYYITNCDKTNFLKWYFEKDNDRLFGREWFHSNKFRSFDLIDKTNKLTID